MSGQRQLFKLAETRSKRTHPDPGASILHMTSPVSLFSLVTLRPSLSTTHPSPSSSFTGCTSVPRCNGVVSCTSAFERRGTVQMEWPVVRLKRWAVVPLGPVSRKTAAVSWSAPSRRFDRVPEESCHQSFTSLFRRGARRWIRQSCWDASSWARENE